RLHVVFGRSLLVWLCLLAHGLLSHRLGPLRHFQGRDVPLGVKPPEDFQAASLILLAAVFLLGVGWLDPDRRRFVPASLDFGVNKRKKHCVIVARNRRAVNVELEWLRVLKRTGRVGATK